MTFNRTDNQSDVYDKDGRLAKTIRTFDTILASDWTSFECEYPDTKTEIYKFKDGNSVIKTVTVVYTSSSKSHVSTVTRS